MCILEFAHVVGIKKVPDNIATVQLYVAFTYQVCVAVGE